MIPPPSSSAVAPLSAAASISALTPSTSKSAAFWHANSHLRQPIHLVRSTRTPRQSPKSAGVDEALRWADLGRKERQGLARVVVPAHHQQVAVVQRRRAQRRGPIDALPHAGQGRLRE